MKISQYICCITSTHSAYETRCGLAAGCLAAPPNLSGGPPEPFIRPTRAVEVGNVAQWLRARLDVMVWTRPGDERL
jgi:hypothetical protein